MLLHLSPCKPMFKALDAYHNDVMTYLVIGLLSLNKNGNTFKVRQCIF